MGYLYIGIGAVLGAWSRHLLQVSFTYVLPHFPVGTFLANIMGAVVIGAIAPFLHSWPTNVRLGIVTGFLGAMTTLSSFAWEVVQIGETRELLWAFIYWFCSAVVCVAFCWGSYRLMLGISGPGQ